MMPPQRRKWKLYPVRLLFTAVFVTLLSACGFVGFPGVYKIDVEQGNIVTKEMADQLRVGMSKRQVRFILGTPLIEDTFNPDRWDYIYVKRNGNNILDEQLLTVKFEGDTLSEILGDYSPEWQEEDSAESAEDEGVDEEEESAAESAAEGVEAS